MGTPFTLSTFSMSSTARRKLALSRSILLTNAILQTSKASANSHIFSVWTFTPEMALRITTAPPTTLSESLVSVRKFEKPGVSMIFTRHPLQS